MKKKFALGCAVICAIMVFSACQLSENNTDPRLLGKESYENYIKTHALQSETTSTLAYGDNGLETEGTMADSSNTNGGMVSILYPSSFNWADYGKVTSAKNQGDYGTCWAFALCSMLESKILMLEGSALDLSEQQLIVGNNRGFTWSTGGNAKASWYWAGRGPVLENDLPYDYSSEMTAAEVRAMSTLAYRETTYYSINNASISQIKESVFTDGPAFFSFDVYSTYNKGFEGFWRYAQYGSVFVSDYPYFSDGHAVLIIGWDDVKGAWLCKNSWGEYGPNGNGTFWIAYSGHNYDLHFSIANIRIRTGNGIPLYRHYNTSNGDHFYTVNFYEIGYGKLNPFTDTYNKWRYEGIECYVSEKYTAGTVPLYRYWTSTSSGHHFYTTNWNEQKSGNSTWTYEGDECGVFATQVDGSIPLYRYNNSSTKKHLYTTDWSEAGSGSGNWVYEGIQCYVNP